MPVTFPAHQGLIAWAKLLRPRWIDGTALCIAAGSPDLAYALGPWMNRHSHDVVGLLVWAIPFTLMATTLVRWRVAASLAPHLPDLGRLRLRSYGVIGSRRPPLVVTVASTVVGSTSHVAIDAFTHAGRWGAEWLGLGRVIGDVPGRGEFTVARLLQYAGHIGGSAIFVVLLVTIASSGRLEQWYGVGQVAIARNRSTSRRVRFGLGAWLGLAVIVGVVAAGPLDVPSLFFPLVTTTIAILTAGLLLPIEAADGPNQSQVGSIGRRTPTDASMSAPARRQRPSR